MKQARIASFSLVASGLVAALASLGAGAPAAAPAPGPLVVHEWGTYTSFAGANGALLEGMGHEEEPLPAFVYARMGHEPSPFRAFGDPSYTTPIRHVHGKMETPVIYFHTKTPRHVHVRVDFPEGLLTQYYPVASAVGPAVTSDDVDLTAIPGSFLEWDADLVPGGAGAAIPGVGAADPYGFARDVDAALVRAAGAGRVEEERYLFYRGLGRFTPPLESYGARADALLLVNGGPAVPAAFALDARESTARFVPLGVLSPGARPVDLSSAPFRAKDAVVADLSAAV